MAMMSNNVTFPIKDDNNKHSFMLMNQITKDSYSSNLLLLLLTEKGERYYNPEYGTNLLKYIYEPNDSLTANQIEEELKNTVEQYIPEIKITKVSFNWNVDDDSIPILDNQLNVNVQFIYNEGILSEEGSIDLNF